jgi:hypothetical protein
MLPSFDATYRLTEIPAAQITTTDEYPLEARHRQSGI